MALTTSQKSNLISDIRLAETKLLQAAEAIRALKLRYVALDFGNVIQDSDFIGDNLGLTKVDFVAAVGSADAVETLLEANNNAHLTALNKMRI